METLSRPHTGAGATPVNTHFSTRRSVAAAILFGPLTGDFFDARFAPRAPTIQAFSERVSLSHDWALTVDLLRGVDAGLEGAGKPGLYGMGQAHRTLGKFKRILGSRGPLAWTDLPDLLRLPGTDRAYLATRYWRGYRSRLPFAGGRAAVARYRSSEADLSRLSMRLGARLRVRLRSGKTLEEECRIPPGFAGDPQREERMRDKFRREARPVLGSAAAGILAALEEVPQGRVKALFGPLRNAQCGEAHV
jgi:hypothetical protein